MVPQATAWCSSHRTTPHEHPFVCATTSDLLCQWTAIRRQRITVCTGPLMSGKPSVLQIPLGREGQESRMAGQGYRGPAYGCRTKCRQFPVSFTPSHTYPVASWQMACLNKHRVRRLGEVAIARTWTRPARRTARFSHQYTKTHNAICTSPLPASRDVVCPFSLPNHNALRGT